MAYGGRNESSKYYDNIYDAVHTNGGMDVSILETDVDHLRDDLAEKIGFKLYDPVLTEMGPGDTHQQWIWVKVQK